MFFLLFELYNKMFGTLVALFQVFLLLYCLVYIVSFMLFDADLRLIFVEKFGKKIDHLRGRVAWITGASSGIGEELAKTLARNGVKLVISARRLDELERVKAECLQNTPLEAKDIFVLPMDITRTDLHADLFRRVIDYFGNLDILVNNAGRSQRATWEDIELDVDQQMFDLNVFGPISLTRIVVKYFLGRGFGHVAVVSSLAGVIPAAFSGSYTASKYAINGYYGSLRFEKIDTNLKVSILCPGPVFTNFLQSSMTEKVGENFGQTTTSTDRRMTAQRCADLCGVALANEITEAWISQSPLLIVAYLAVYYPIFFNLFVKFFGAKIFLKLRDSRHSMPTNTS